MFRAGFIFVLLSWATSVNGLAGGCDEGFTAFKSRLYPVLRANCVACHDTGGKGPPHSSADPKAAYAESLSFAEFPDFESSAFIRQVRRRHWLKHDPEAKGIPQAEMSQALSQWWDQGEFRCQQTAALTTAEQVLPAELPSAQQGGYASLKFDLGVHPLLKGCALQVQIQIFNRRSDPNPQSYRLKEPSVICAGAGPKPVKLKGVRFLLNGKTEMFENIYDSAESVIRPEAGVFQALLSKHLLILVEKEIVEQRISAQVMAVTEESP